MLLCRHSGCRHRATTPTNVVKCRHRGKFLIFRAAGTANYDSSVRMQAQQDLHHTCISGRCRGPVRDYPVTSVMKPGGIGGNGLLSFVKLVALRQVKTTRVQIQN